MQSPMRSTSFARFLFQYRKRYGLHAILSFHTGIRSLRVSIPQAVWIACNFQFPRVSYNAATFQYRKRYGLHAIIGHAPSNEHRSVSIPQAVWIACNVESDVSHPGWCGFNTASGMDCMQFSCGDAPLHEIGVSIPQAVWIACNFLFLKGSDQMNTVSIPQAVWIACNLDEWYPLLPTERVSIPQAVWIACNQERRCRRRSCRVSIPQAVWIACNGKTSEAESPAPIVSIPQAVWIACNLRKRRKSKPFIWFQYRKRYGLHAILSPGSLGNSEPRSRFSDTDPLFAFFPKVRGTFLSRKVLRKGLEASHSKGTFVHERNLILMAFSLDFRASLEQSIS